MDGTATGFVAQPLDVATSILGHAHLQIVLDLDRSFSREEVERAAAGTVAAFPVLGCRYVPGAWCDRWVPDPAMSVSDVVQAPDATAGLEAATREWLAREFDEREGWPWRVALLPREGGSRLLVSVLHVVSDAAGALTAVRELGRILAGGAPVDRPHPTGRNVGMLFRRLGLRGWLRLAAALLRETIRPLELAFLARTARATAPPAGASLRRTVRIGVGEGTPLRALCRKHRATVNDLLVAALAVLVRRVSSRGRVGCFYTADLRRRLIDGSSRVANLSAAISIAMPRACAASLPDALAETVRRTSRRSTNETGLAAILFNLPAVLFTPHGLVRRLTRLVFRLWIRRLLTRGLLVTNVGPLDPWLASFGGTVRDATFVGPSVRPLPIPVLTATGFGDVLSVHFNGYEETAPALERLAGELQAVFAEADGG